ncbi:MAG: GerAB/ArcD/ProY family transporter [Bacillota bacterium]
MREQGKFGVAEAVVLLTMSLMARIFLTFPRYILEVAGTAAWLSALAGLIFALLQVYIFTLILKPHPDKNIMDVTEEALGRAAGTAANVIYALYFVIVAAFFMRPFTEALLISTLPRTPISVVTTGFIITSILGAYVGLEAMARSARITYPFVLGGTVVLLLGVSPQWEVTNIFPILGTGPREVFFRGGFTTGTAVEILLAAVIVQSFHGPAFFWRVLSRAMLMGFLYLALLELVMVMTVTWNVAVEYSLPLYNLSRLIYLSRFFQRIESIFVIIWGFIGMVKVSLTLYAAAAVLARTLRLPDYRPLTWPLAMIIFVVSLLPPDMPTAMRLESEFIRTYIAWVPTMALPAIVLAADRFRTGGRKNEAD